MQLGMIGLGRMGANMVRRLQRGGHQCVAFDRSPDAVKDVEQSGARGTNSLKDFVASLSTPRAIWIMVPAAVVDSVLKDLRPLLQRGDILIDGGNSHYHDDIRRAAELADAGIHYVDVGTSGGGRGLGRAGADGGGGACGGGGGGGGGARATDAEPAPLSNPSHFQYQLDIAAVAELWRHGSISGASLPDLTPAA